MDDKEQKFKTYRSLSDMHRFRLRLFAEGILTGIFAGIVISFFRFALSEMEYLRGALYNRLWVSDWSINACWFAVLIAIAFILHKLNCIEPMAAGSGIPQVKGAILGLMKMRWLHILWVKLTAGIIGIGAGLAAAFNAPLAGVIFALEELHRNFSIMVLLPSMAAAFTATIISRAIFGRATIFDIPDLQLLPISYYGIVILVALASGLAGVIFNWGLLNIGRFYSLPCFKRPVEKIAFALICAGILGYFLPEVLGGGNDLINHLAKAPVSLQLLLIFLAGKLIFTLISYGCGVPGGFFLPMLVIGALCGSICAQILIMLGWIEPAYATNIMVVAMAALFASSVRAPITGTVLIMEMTASYQQLLSLAIAAMVAFVIAELCHSKPIYEELMQRMLHKKAPEPAVLEQRNVIELAVCSGSSVSGKLIKDIPWPPNTLLVDVKRGESQLIPAGDTRLLSGDFIYILTATEHVEELTKMVEE